VYNIYDIYDLKEFFKRITWEEMKSINFQNPLIADYISITLFQITESENLGVEFFNVRKEPALAMMMFNADMETMERTGQKLLFSIGLFPDHFIARGKRTVSLGYYQKVLLNIINLKLSPSLKVWREIEKNYKSTIR